jgi:DNA topoisomerase-1
MAAVPRLRRSDCSGPGIARVRHGRGFAYRHHDGRRVTERETLDRIAALAIPPAWRDVWICDDPLGHLQATGVDDAGRKQYRYHDQWRTRRDQAKFDDMEDFARALPLMRRRVERHLRGSELDQRRVLACSVRLLDLGFFRIGSEDYAVTNKSYGLATMLKRHATVEDGYVVFDYRAKSGKRRIQSIADPAVLEIVAELKARRGGTGELLAYRENRRWHDIRSDDINDYVKQVAGEQFSAKDFRTWNATVLAAVALALAGERPASKTGRNRAITAAVKRVSAYLGNTPAVCRNSYIDPRVFDRFRSGWMIGVVERLRGEVDFTDKRARRQIEDAVLDLLADDRSPALERI